MRGLPQSVARRPRFRPLSTLPLLALTLLGLAWWSFSRLHDAREQAGPVLLVGEDEVVIEAFLGETEVSQTITYHNSGDADLRLLRVSASCGCLVAGGWEAPIPPGGKGHLRLRYEVPASLGPRRHRIALESNEVGREPRLINVRIDVRPLFRIVPAEVALGRLPVGATFRRTATLHREHPDTPLRADRASSRAGLVSAGIEVAGGKQTLVVLGRALQEEGSYDDLVEVWAHGYAQPVLAVPIKFAVGDPPFVDPDRVFFGKIRLGERSTKRVIIGLREDDSAVRLAPAEPAPSGESVTVRLEHRAQEQRSLVHFSWQPRRADAVLSQEVPLMISSDDGSTRIVVVSCYGES